MRKEVAVCPQRLTNFATYCRRVYVTGRSDEEPRNGPTGSKPGLIENEELAFSVPVSGPPSPCSWHESIPLGQEITAREKRRVFCRLARR
jgi:hypothetical protein